MNVVTEILGLSLDRQSLAIARGDTLLVEPVLVATQRDAAGEAVLSAQRVLDALRACLDPVPAGDARAVFAVPADFDAAAVARLAQVCSMVGLNDVAFVDAIALTSAMMHEPRSAAVLQMGWRDFIVSRVRHERLSTREATWLHATASLTQLHDCWIESVAAAMVKQTRFDPLHDRTGEQALFAQLPSALDAAQRVGTARFTLESAGTAFAVEFAAKHFDEAAARFYTAVIDALLATQVAGQPLLCIVPEVVKKWPGFLARLHAAASAGVTVLPDGALARGARAIVDEVTSGRAYWTMPPLDRDIWAADLVPHSNPGSSRPELQQVTHVLYQGQTIPLVDGPLVVGRSPVADSVSIALPDAVAGVSRRHCSVLRDDGATRVVDHSTYGTWVNGARVSREVTVFAGDCIRVGMPGIELKLIAGGERDDGAT